MDVEEIGVEPLFAVGGPAPGGGKGADRTLLLIQGADQRDLPVHLADHLRQVAVDHFVAERPHCDRRVVAGRVEKLLKLPRIDPGECVRIDGVGETPAPFVVDHDAALVGNLQRLRHDRHMGVAHHHIAVIQVTEQERFELPLHFCGGCAGAAVIHRRNIFAEKIDRLAIQQKLPVRNAELPEAEPGARGGYDFTVTAGKRQQKVVQIRGGDAPPPRILQRYRQCELVDARLQRQMRQDGFTGDGTGILFHRRNDPPCW